MTTPRLAESVKGRGRHYRHPDTGDLLPSITNVLGVIDKPGLMWWLCRGALGAAWDDREAFYRMGDRDAAINAYKSAAYKASNKKANLGTAVHDACEQFVQTGRLPNLDDPTAPFVEQYAVFLEDFGAEVDLTERSVLNLEDGYAGTFDAVIDFPQARLMVDIKTGKRVYDEAALQLCGLAWAPEMATDDGVEAAPTVDGAAVLHLRDDGFELVPVDTSEATFDAVRGAVLLWRFVKGGGADGALRPAAVPGGEVAA